MKKHAIHDEKQCIFHGMHNALVQENESLKQRVLELEKQKIKTIYMRSRKKGQGAFYGPTLKAVNYKHRQILYALLVNNATDEQHAIPTVQIRKFLKVGQAPASGRMSELIGRGYVETNKVRITFQVSSEGVPEYRPETEIDERLGVLRYKRFVYWLAPRGIKALYDNLKPEDNFVQIPKLEAWMRIATVEQKLAMQKILAEQSMLPVEVVK